MRFGGWPVLSLGCEGSGGARAGLDGAIAPSESCLALASHNSDFFSHDCMIS